MDQHGHSNVDFALACFAVLLLAWRRLPSWAVVIVTTGFAWVIAGA